MRHRQIITFSAAILLSALCLSSCAGNDCLDNKSALPFAGLYASGTLQSLSVSDLTIYGIGAPGDSVLYQSATLKNVYLPFRIDTDETRYVFRYDIFASEETDPAEIPSDTITFRYTRQPWFNNAACGATYNFELTDISWTSFVIDSISAVEAVITNKNIENLKIFFRTEDSESVSYHE